MPIIDNLIKTKEVPINPIKIKIDNRLDPIFIPDILDMKLIFTN